MELTQSGVSPLFLLIEATGRRLGINEFRIRTALVRVYPSVPNKEMNQELAKKTLFFIFSTGRSGSKFLAELLGKSLNAIVAHEPVPLETIAYLKAIHEPEAAVQYICSFRKKQIYLFTHSKLEPIYGEINSILRRHIDPITRLWPSAKLFHLVRHPMHVIRSIMNRHVFLEDHPVLKPAVLASSTLSRSEWVAMPRFEKVCHIWQEDNAFIRERVKHFVRFEDLIADYDYFKFNLLDVLGLHVDQDTWAGMVNRPVNVSTRRQFPPFEKWSRDQRETFKRLCGPEMAYYGYTFTDN